MWSLPVKRKDFLIGGVGRGQLYQITWVTSNRAIQKLHSQWGKNLPGWKQSRNPTPGCPLADNYTLTHQEVFVKSDPQCRPPGAVRGANLPVSGNRYNLKSNDKGQNDPPEQRRRSHSSVSSCMSLLQTQGACDVRMLGTWGKGEQTKGYTSSKESWVSWKHYHLNRQVIT